MKKNVIMKPHSKLLFFRALSVANIIEAKPIHQIAGLPNSAIVELTPREKLDKYNHTGFSIRGQLHHADEKAWVAFRVE